MTDPANEQDETARPGSPKRWLEVLFELDGLGMEYLEGVNPA